MPASYFPSGPSSTSDLPTAITGSGLLLNRHLRSAGKPTVNMKRMLRIMQNHGLTLERHTAVVLTARMMGLSSRCTRISDGALIISSCMPGESRGRPDPVRARCLRAREIMAWSAVANAGISGEIIHDLMIAAVERRFKRHMHAASSQLAVQQRKMSTTSPRTLPTSRALSA